MLLNFAEACRSTIDCDFVVLLILIKLIFYAVVDQVENHLIHIQTFLLLECEHSLVVEEERQRTCCTQVSAELVEDRTNVSNSTCSVVCQSINEDSHSVRAISLVCYFLVIAGILATSVLDGTSDVILRHVLTLTVSDDSTQ